MVVYGDINANIPSRERGVTRCDFVKEYVDRFLVTDCLFEGAMVVKRTCEEGEKLEKMLCLSDDAKTRVFCDELFLRRTTTIELRHMFNTCHDRAFTEGSEHRAKIIRDALGR